MTTTDLETAPLAALITEPAECHALASAFDHLDEVCRPGTPWLVQADAHRAVAGAVETAIRALPYIPGLSRALWSAVYKHRNTADRYQGADRAGIPPMPC